MTLTKVYVAVQKLNVIIYDEETSQKMVKDLTEIRTGLMEYIKEQSLITKEKIL